MQSLIWCFSFQIRSLQSNLTWIFTMGKDIQMHTMLSRDVEFESNNFCRLSDAEYDESLKGLIP